MNAHEMFVANIVDTLTPADIAAMVVPDVQPEPPDADAEAEVRLDKLGRPIRPRRPRGAGKAANGLGLRETHTIVLEHATADTRRTWAEKLGDAVKEPRADRPATWWLPLAEMIFEVELEDEAADAEAEHHVDASRNGHLAEVA